MEVEVRESTDEEIKEFESGKRSDSDIFLTAESLLTKSVVGYMKVSRDGEINVYVIDYMRGVGIGTKIVEKSIQYIIANYGFIVSALHAYVEDSNESAKKMFLKCGFLDSGNRVFVGIKYNVLRRVLFYD